MEAEEKHPLVRIAEALEVIAGISAASRPTLADLEVREFMRRDAPQFAPYTYGHPGK